MGSPLVRPKLCRQRYESSSYSLYHYWLRVIKLCFLELKFEGSKELRPHRPFFQASLPLLTPWSWNYKQEKK
jgi:hypothetical protein